MELREIRLIPDLEKCIWLKIKGGMITLEKQATKQRATVLLKLMSDQITEVFRVDNIFLNLNDQRDIPITQHWSDASVKLLDKPVLHPRIKSKGTERFLNFIICKAMVDCWRDFENRDGVFSGVVKFLETEFSHVATLSLPTFYLLEQGAAHIPCEFVRVCNIQKSKPYGPVYADVQVGHHLYFKSVNIFDPDVSRDKIFLVGAESAFFRTISDERIVKIINYILSSDVFSSASWYIKHDTPETVLAEIRGLSFVQALPSASLALDAIPPRVRFW